jgi:hypothetical protein
MYKKIINSFYSFLIIFALPSFAGSKYRCQVELFPNNENMEGVYRNDSIALDVDEKLNKQSIELTYYTFIQPKESRKKLILKKQNKRLSNFKIHYRNSQIIGLLFTVQDGSSFPIIEAIADYNSNSIRLSTSTYPYRKNLNTSGVTKLTCSKIEFWKDDNI